MTLEELKQYIMELNPSTASSMVDSQIKKFTDQGYTYYDIYKAIWYHYEYKHNDVSALERYGIGIVSYVHDAANKYFDQLQKNKETKINAAKAVLEEQVEERTYTPARRFFDKGEIDIGDL